MDSENPNCSSSRACAKCRSYKFRLYHPGRLKYPLKQTKKRGDLSGFVRISWEQALDEIARKHKAVTDKYGPESFHSIYACGAYSSSWQGGGYTGIWTGISTSAAASLMGGYAKYTHDYSFHQRSFFGTGYTGYNGGSADANTVASAVKNIVLWGSNALSTVNSSAYSEIRSAEMMKERGGKIWFIGPEFVDTGVTLADTWYQMKPYTDTALILGMLYHAIDTTFDVDGNRKEGGLLDVDYVDTMVYGFFDSPEYYINKSTGTISFTDPQDGSVKVNAVPAGRSLSAYIMGSDARLTKADYNGNYVADQFAAKQPKRNGSVCSYTAAAGEATKYQTKKDFLTPKTPLWASAITGIPEQAIKDLAELYFNPDNHLQLTGL